MTWSPRQRAWLPLLKKPGVVLSLLWLSLLLVAFVWPDLLATRDPAKTDVTLTRVYEGPSTEYWLGTDGDGRDYYSRVVYGGQLAITSILIAMSIAIGLGVPLGLASAWHGGWVDKVFTWLVDVLFSIPIILLAIAVITVLEPSLASSSIGIGIALSARFARLSRAMTLAEKEELYVDAARISGLSSPRILSRYILPNILPALIVQFAVLSGGVVLVGAALSFLGLGASLQDPDWGMLINISRSTFRANGFWQVVPGGAALVLTVLSFNLLGDALGSLAAGGRTEIAPPARKRRKSTRSAMATIAPPAKPESLFSIEGMSIEFPGAQKGELIKVVQDVSLKVERGETLGVVGESGSGKSITMLTALGLTPAPGYMSEGVVRFRGEDITNFSERQWRTIRGKHVGFIFQEPLAHLNPALRVSKQLMEPLLQHCDMTRGQARKRAVELLAEVQIPDPGRRVNQYPHEFSGGMAQRVGIALALACEPALLIADEPTTALDVTVQGQILDLLSNIQERHNMGTIMITHDLGVLAEVADRIAVMYAGQIVEESVARNIFLKPRHPYTHGLLATMPQNQVDKDSLWVIAGTLPTATASFRTCRFAPRCPHAVEQCRNNTPLLTTVEDGVEVRCIRAAELRLSDLPAASA